MSPDPQATLVLAPEITFARLRSALGTLGWRRSELRSAHPPLVTGEPEFAAWRRERPAARLSYSFNPVVALRVLDIRAADAAGAVAGIARALPILGPHDVDGLLAATDPRRALLGAMAARAMGLHDRASRIAQLTDHPDPAVARTAAAILREMTADARVGKTQAIGEALAETRYPADAAPAERRQFVRRAGQLDGQASEPVLRVALADPDLEVRASAMLLAARTSLAALSPDVARTDLGGLRNRDRRLIEAMRRAALASLEGRRPPEKADDGDGTSTMRDHVWRCVLGLPVSVQDDILLTTIALTMALDLPPVPQTGPLGSPAAGAYTLAPLSTRFRWVAPIPHWLGHDDATPIANPIRQWTPPAGALIAEAPLTGADTRALGLPDQGPVEAPALLTADQAASVLAHMSTAAGTPVSMPSADLLEAALRGPDGRRHPWGFEAPPSDPQAASPWGCHWAGGTGAWTADRTADGQPVIAGTDRRARPSLRIAAAGDPADRFVLRPAIPLTID